MVLRRMAFWLGLGLLLMAAWPARAQSDALDADLISQAEAMFPGTFAVELSGAFTSPAAPDLERRFPIGWQYGDDLRGGGANIYLRTVARDTRTGEAVPLTVRISFFSVFERIDDEAAEVYTLREWTRDVYENNERFISVGVYPLDSDGNLREYYDDNAQGNVYVHGAFVGNALVLRLAFDVRVENHDGEQVRAVGTAVFLEPKYNYQRMQVEPGEFFLLGQGSAAINDTSSAIQVTSEGDELIITVETEGVIASLPSQTIPMRLTWRVRRSNAEACSGGREEAPEFLPNFTADEVHLLREAEILWGWVTVCESEAALGTFGGSIDQEIRFASGDGLMLHLQFNEVG
jgi:hypothetical protein